MNTTGFTPNSATPKRLITRHHIEQIAHLFAQHDAIFLAGVGDEGRHEATWRRLMGSR